MNSLPPLRDTGISGEGSRRPPNLAKVRSSKTEASARNDPGRPGERELHGDTATVRASRSARWP